MQMSELQLTAQHRKNLLKLADYLESLPKDYKHFDMATFASHYGNHDLPMPSDVMAAKSPKAFLADCGTVACAVGHGPAAGIAVKPDELLASTFGGRKKVYDVAWGQYSGRVFGVDPTKIFSGSSRVFQFLFGGDWDDIDNHHYGAAARIRYFLDTGVALDVEPSARRKYAPYRLGSKARQLETA
jgi:hypothetical protein